MSVRRRRSSHVPSLALVAILAGAAAGCGGGDEAARLREENEELKRQLAEAGAVADAETAALVDSDAPDAPAPAADDWAWADAPGDEPSSSRPAEPEARPPQPKPIEMPKPRPTPPAPEPAPEPTPEPTNRLSPAPAEPEPPPRVARTVRAGTTFDARLEGELSAKNARVGDAVQAVLDGDVVDGAGNVVLPAGTRLSGRVTEVKAPGKAKKKAVLAFRFEQATLPDGTTAAVSAGRRLEGDGYTKKDGIIIGSSAAGGALLGQVLGKDSESTVAGAVLGGAVATGVVMSKRGDDIVVPAGTILGLELETPVTVDRPR